jgi:hypothetical protein
MGLWDFWRVLTVSGNTFLRIRNAKVSGSIPLGSTKLGLSVQILTILPGSDAAITCRAVARSKAVRRVSASASRR